MPSATVQSSPSVEALAASQRTERSTIFGEATSRGALRNSSGLRYRDMVAVLFAVLADSVQLGTTVITLGGDLLALPAQLVFSCFVSAVL